MFAHYLGLAARSLARNAGLTTLMVVAVGIGIGASMTMITVVHVISGDPLPARSAHLYIPHLDPRPKDASDNLPTDDLSWPDAQALMRGGGASLQAMMSDGLVMVRNSPSEPAAHASYESARYTTPGFFQLFGVPLVQGRGFDEAEESARAQVAVIDATLSQRLFGTSQGVGRALRIGEANYTVIGINDAWNPQPMFYKDLGAGHGFGEPEVIFLPLSTAMANHLNAGHTACWAKVPDAADTLTSPDCSWLQLWVELADAGAVARYRQFLDNYWQHERARGRFTRHVPPELFDLRQWLARAKLAPGDVQLQLWLSIGFLVVCLVNIVALLMAKFLRRSAEISVRRALGATRRAIFAQFAMEAWLVGIGGALLGVLVAGAGLWTVRQRPDDYARLAHMDLTTLFYTVTLAMGATVLAGLLPAWRACRVAPALQLKSL
ncbi:ABC transporter permease [Pinirhizobacter sp.]|jgi:putative ABC transport system permease protein|uniref:ABC transporter permease n=1 Tax=Pinirhizobacter sp. TaxID=2950432 RepID=UPI002F3F4A35